MRSAVAITGYRRLRCFATNTQRILESLKTFRKPLIAIYLRLKLKRRRLWSRWHLLRVLPSNRSTRTLIRSRLLRRFGRPGRTLDSVQASPGVGEVGEH